MWRGIFTDLDVRAPLVVMRSHVFAAVAKVQARTVEFLLFLVKLLGKGEHANYNKHLGDAEQPRKFSLASPFTFTLKIMPLQAILCQHVLAGAYSFRGAVDGFLGSQEQDAALF